MPELGEDEGRTGDTADFAEAGSDVLQGAPAAGEQGEPAFAEAAQGPQTLIAGSLHRSQAMIFPSKITCENPSSLARSSAWRRSGACPARTMMTSSR